MARGRISSVRSQRAQGAGIPRERQGRNYRRPPRILFASDGKIAPPPPANSPALFGLYHPHDRDAPHPIRSATKFPTHPLFFRRSAPWWFSPAAPATRFPRRRPISSHPPPPPHPSLLATQISPRPPAAAARSPLPVARLARIIRPPLPHDPAHTSLVGSCVCARVRKRLGNGGEELGGDLREGRASHFLLPWVAIRSSAVDPPRERSVLMLLLMSQLQVVDLYYN
nr:formin-like protein 5 [Lolium perenne]